MKAALLDLFTSKKFLAALTACIVAGVGRFGLHVDPAVLDRIWIALLAYVGAQGIADVGKSAAGVLAAGVPPVPVPAKPVGLSVAPPPGAGTAAMLVVLLLGGLALVPACGGSQSSRADTIVTLDSGIQTATAALRTYEHEHAMAIIDAATDKASGHASLVAFRIRVDKVWKVVDVARAAIDAANTVNDDTSLAGAQVALVNAINAVTAITGGSP